MKTTQLNVIFWQEHHRDGPVIIAQGLQLDLTAVGRTLQEAMSNMASTIVVQCKADQMLGRPPFWDTPQAEPRYWHALRHGPPHWQLQIVHPDDSTGMESWRSEAG